MDPEKPQQNGPRKTPTVDTSKKQWFNHTRMKIYIGLYIGLLKAVKDLVADNLISREWMNIYVFKHWIYSLDRPKL